MQPNRIAVIGEKRGVGQYAVAVNPAPFLATAGKQVGVLDGDVHGPDVYLMFGCNRSPGLKRFCAR